MQLYPRAACSPFSFPTSHSTDPASVGQRLDARMRILIQSQESAFNHTFHRRGVGGGEAGGYRETVASNHFPTDAGSVVARIGTE
jgi:hypothetical protein